MTRPAWVMLLLAVVAGSAIRFWNLGGHQLNADEAASWAAASAPTFADIAERQAELNAGKLPLHDFLLHGWMGLAGESEVAMRALSAALGTIAIVLVFVAARELFRLDQDARLREPDAAGAAATAALVFALNLAMIKYAREARMYPLALALVLAQVALFARASRTGSVASLSGVAVLTALAVSAHFSAILVPGFEAVWLAYVATRVRRSNIGLRSRSIIKLAAALAAGGVLLLPALPAAVGSAMAAVERGAINWIEVPAPWEPVAFLNRGSGTFAFPLLAALAAYGVLRGWTRAPDATRFMLLWMWAPPLAAVAASYAWRPVFIERYLLSSFVPFFILAGLGLWLLGRASLRTGALALLVLAVAIRFQSYFSRPHDADWREAAAVVARNLGADETATAIPPYAVEVLRYYLPPELRAQARRLDESGSADVIVVQADIARRRAGEAARVYPKVVGRARGVEVRRR